jgi:sorbitol-specific phosphotransferase system component IIBC
MDNASISRESGTKSPNASHDAAAAGQVPLISKISEDGEGDEMDRVLTERAIDMLNKVIAGLGRVVALYYRSSNVHQNHSENRYLCF